MLEKELKLTRCIYIWCHRIVTKSQRSRSTVPRKAVQKCLDYVLNYKLLQVKCEKCGKKVTSETVSCFDMDHRVTKMDEKFVIVPEKERKIASISNIVKTGMLKALKAEIVKCRMLCCRCHRILSLDQFRGTSLYDEIVLYKDQWSVGEDVELDAVITQQDDDITQKKE